jgi:2-keto-4-pentenoate hydratase
MRRARDAADWLMRVRTERRLIGTLPPDLLPEDADGAAAVQRAIADAMGGAVVGFKIGATGARMQAYLGLDAPIGGVMLAADVHQSPSTLAFADFVKPGVECEIAVRLGRDLPHGPCDAERAAASIADVFAGIEVVENHYAADAPSVGVLTIASDRMYHAAAVLGAKPATPFDPRAMATLRGTMTVDGVLRDSGEGTGLLGDPLRCLMWLAESPLAAAFGGLRAGQVVLLGSVTPPLWLDAPATVTVAFDGLPPVNVRLS